MDRPSTFIGASEALFRPAPADSGARLKLAKRPAAIAGLRIGFLGNLKPNCDVLLHTTEEGVSRLGAAGTLYREKESCSLGAAPELLEEIAASCQAAVVALGD